MTKKTDKVRGAPVTISGKTGGVSQVVPTGVPPVLRRFWNFARSMAKEFAKNLLKNREDEFLKVIRRDFEKWG